jgi:transposase
VDAMIALRRSGLKLVQIADRFNVSDSFVSLAVRGLRRQYRELPAQRRAS